MLQILLIVLGALALVVAGLVIAAKQITDGGKRAGGVDPNDPNP